MKIRFYLLIFLLSISIISPVFSQTELKGWGKIYPKDESSADKSFSEFLIDLKIAVNNYHVNFIEGIISPVIELEYDNSFRNNYQSFMNKYNLRDSLNEFWTSAKKILSNGSIHQKV